MAGSYFSGVLQKLVSSHKRLNIDTSVAELQICAYICIVSRLGLLRVFTCKYVISLIYLEWASHDNKGEKGVSLGVCLASSVLAGCVLFLFDYFV